MNSGTSNRPIRVLVADDSSFARELICAVLNSEPGVSVVGEAVNGLDAVAKVLELKPDLVTMDIEMPILGGLDAIERIMREFPVPILVITAQSGVRAAFAAVSKGAMDVVEKPDISFESARKLVKKVRMLSSVDIGAYLAAKNRGPGKARAPAVIPKTAGVNAGVIAIAASTGGPQALHTILSRLPADLPVPIIIAQHIADGFTTGMVEWLNGGTSLSVCELHHGDRLVSGTVYVNPAEFSVVCIRREGVLLKRREDGDRYHPSCNALLSGVATAYRDRAVGVILSGMGNDGVDGMAAIRAGGGITIAQDARSSVVYGMNRLAVEGGHIDSVMPLNHIPAAIMQLVGGKGR
ncbi:MAG: chemotaxis-specific protein-glutamate methyltransferase CheB [Pseudomonadota bacterium]